MTVRLVACANPEELPEHHLWTLTKDTRRVECRVRMVPFGTEYRIYDNGAFLRSEVARDGRNVGDVAEAVKAEWIARGWAAP